MLLSDEQVDARLGSLDNLFNRLHGSGLGNGLVNNTYLPEKPSRSGPVELPSLPPSIDSLIDTAEEKIKLAHANTAALDILNGSLAELKLRLCEVESPKDLSRIATDMGKLINGNNQDKKSGNNMNQVIIYKPVMSTENRYETIVAAHET